MFNPNKNFNKTNKKEVVKHEKEILKHHVGVVTHADYEKQQEIVQAPFGKQFKTGAIESKKVYKREKPVKGRDF